VFLQVRLVGFGQHEDRLDGVEGVARLVPERRRHLAGDVAAEAVDVGFAHPVQHRIRHALPQALLGPVEAGHVGPVFRLGAIGVGDREDLALGVQQVPVLVFDGPGLSKAVWLATQSMMTFMPSRGPASPGP
jgi:hypothetical protein